MNLLLKKITHFFPEIDKKQLEENIDLPYLMMSSISEWVIDKSKNGLSMDLIKRIIEFSKWCKTIPEGNSATNDIHTIFVCSFYETICENKSTQFLIKKITSKKDFMMNETYLQNWIGVKNYEQILKSYDV